jgi:hemoglobin
MGHGSAVSGGGRRIAGRRCGRTGQTEAPLRSARRVYPIAAVVDDFIERLLVNHTLNANPAIEEARARVPKAGLKFQVVALMCEVTGGPCKYTGRSMKESHQKLNITEGQWQAMIVDFRKTLDKFKVPAREQDELIAIVASSKKDIVQPAMGRR